MLRVTKLLSGLLVGIFLWYSPVLSIFLSHDDFFLLRVSRASNFGDFLNFFNLIKSQSGSGFYRPLTSQLYYFLAALLGQTPFVLHSISLMVFILLVVVVYRLSWIIFKSQRLALVSALLYGTSTANFTRLYWPAVFQETGVNLFIFASVFFFWRYLDSRRKTHFGLSVLSFLAALMSKESAVILPGLLFLVLFYRSKFREILALLPYLIFLGVYLFLHYFYYGFTRGDSYIWDFSPRVLNTLFWYVLWAFNVPENLVDFVGPGLRFNPNALKFFGSYFVPTVAIAISMIGMVVLMAFREILAKRRQTIKVVAFCCGWFIVGIIPVIFFPWHKQSYEEGTALIGLTLLIAFLLSRGKRRIVIIFGGLWLVSAIVTNFFTYSNSWVISGAMEARRVFNYVHSNKPVLEGKSIVFYDEPRDRGLPWIPSNQIKLDLSDQDFFMVYFPTISAVYTGDVETYQSSNYMQVRARRFLGY